MIARAGNSPLFWGALSIVAALALEGCFFLDATTPLRLGGDHLFLLTQARLMMEGEGVWRSALLGFPFGQDTRYFPGFEPLLKAVLFVVAHLTGNVFVVVKAFLSLGVAAMAAAGFWCLRKLSIRPWVACVGAVAFVVTPYFAMRIPNHDYIGLYVAAAFGSALALLIVTATTWRDAVAQLRSPFGLTALLVIATCGIYYAFFSLFFMSLACSALAVRVASFKPVIGMAAIACGVVIALVIGGFGPGIADLSKSVPRRLAIEQLYHGISISDAIYLLRDHLGVQTNNLVQYDQLRPNLLVGEGWHEWPGFALTLAILAAPLIVLGQAVGVRFPDLRLAAAAAFIVVGLIFAHRGGAGYLFNALVFPAIRAQSRMMPFLTFFALVIVCGGAEALLRPDPWSRRVIGLLLPLALIASLLPARFALARAQQWTASDPTSQAQVTSWRALIPAKTARGLEAVLQLPVAPWPEQPQRNGFDFYTHQLGLIFDRPGSPTQWSYGASGRESGYAAWLAGLMPDRDPDGLPARARAAGFDAILVEKKAFSPEELDSLLNALRALPPPCLVYEDALRALFDIARAPGCATQPG